MLALGPDLLSLTAQMAAASSASPFFAKSGAQASGSGSTTGLKRIYAV
jgi:hypothetical protein